MSIFTLEALNKALSFRERILLGGLGKILEPDFVGAANGSSQHTLLSDNTLQRINHLGYSEDVYKSIWEVQFTVNDIAVLPWADLILGSSYVNKDNLHPYIDENSEILGAGFLYSFLVDLVIKRIESDISTSFKENPYYKDRLQSHVKRLFININNLCHKTLLLELTIYAINKSEILKNIPIYQRIQIMYSDLDYLKSFLNEYVALNKLVAVECDKWMRSVAKLISDFLEDKTLIVEKFGFEIEDDLMPLLVQDNAGDSHNYGKSVQIIELGTGQLIVYKPHDTSADRLYHLFQDRIMEKLSMEKFSPEYLVCHDHTWVSFISHELLSSDNTEAIERFSYRQGVNLALLLLFNSNDMHYENIIAHGEFPVMIDLETIMLPTVLEDSSLADDSRFVLKSMHSSVLRSGLLPHSTKKKGGWGVQIGGLVNVGGQALPKKSKRAYFDNNVVKYEEVEVKMENGHNLPFEAGDGRASLSIEKLISGFRDSMNMNGTDQFYESVRNSADHFKVKSRNLFRPTMTYSLLLGESVHPDLLRHGRDRDSFFDKLWLGFENRRKEVEIIEKEHSALSDNDIPYFFSLSDQRSVNTYQGSVEDFYYMSGIDTLREHLNSLGQVHIYSNEWIIANSFRYKHHDLDFRSTLDLVKILQMIKVSYFDKISFWTVFGSNINSYVGLMDISVERGMSGILPALVLGNSTNTYSTELAAEIVRSIESNLDKLAGVEPNVESLKTIKSSFYFFESLPGLSSFTGAILPKLKHYVPIGEHESNISLEAMGADEKMVRMLTSWLKIDEEYHHSHLVQGLRGGLNYLEAKKLLLDAFEDANLNNKRMVWLVLCIYNSKLLDSFAQIVLDEIESRLSHAGLYPRVDFEYGVSGLICLQYIINVLSIKSGES